MTNSHNRSHPHHAVAINTATVTSTSGRFYNSSSPQSGSTTQNGGIGGSGKKRGAHSKSPVFNYSSTSSLIPISPPRNNSYYNRNNQRSSPGGFNYNSLVSSPSSTSSSPPSSFFAGSKCYDAPAPTALPRPPTHWTCAHSNLRHQRHHDDFSNNLKMMLNVKA